MRASVWVVGCLIISIQPLPSACVIRPHLLLCRPALAIISYRSWQRFIFQCVFNKHWANASFLPLTSTVTSVSYWWSCSRWMGATEKLFNVDMFISDCLLVTMCSFCDTLHFVQKRASVHQTATAACWNASMLLVCDQEDPQQIGRWSPALQIYFLNLQNNSYGD